MKEQMPNVIPDMIGNLDSRFRGNDNANGLTTRPFHPTLIVGGDIFMEGKQDMTPTNSHPTSPEHTEKAIEVPSLNEKKPATRPEKPSLEKRQAYARSYYEKVNKGRIVSVDEKRIQEEIIKIGALPIAGGQEATIDATGVSDPELREIARRFNRRAGRGLVDFPEIDRTVREIEQRLRDPAVSENPTESAWVENIIDQLEAEMAAARSTQGQAQREGEEGAAGQPRPIDDSEITDRDALNLIQRFNQEIGYLDKGKIEQLKRDLSQRINILTNQRLLQSADTPAGVQEIERLEAEMTRLRGVFPDLDQMSTTLSARQGERMSEEERALFDRTNRFLRDLERAGLRLKDIDTVASLTPELRVARASLVKDIEEFIKQSNPVETGGFPSEILRIVRYFKELREGLISELIFKSYEDPSETGEYEMDLYASSNLNTLLGFMSRDDPDRYRYFFSLKTAAHYFHSMNAGILTGNFERFGRIAETINYQHFVNMEEIKGVGVVMRQYEQRYKYYLGKDKRITEAGYTALKRDVERIFRDMNRKGLIKSEYENYRRDTERDGNPWNMEEWEINRALGAGRAFSNITLRGAENIATGQIPEDRKQFASFPQEDMVRVLNWNEWFLRRFKLAEKRHGIEFLGMVTSRHQEFMRYTGEKLGVNKITEFGGVDTRKMENGGQYHTSGVYSGWRMENLAFDQVHFNLNGNRISVQHFMDNIIDKAAVNAIKKRIEDRMKASPNLDPADAVTLEDQQQYKDLFMDLINNLDYGLSMLIKNGNIGGARKLGYLLREEIWKKIANKNTSLMIDYLTNIKYVDGTPDNQKANDINALRGERTQGIIGPLQWEREEVWNAFREKVLLRHERAMKEAMGEGGQLPDLSDEERYTPEEEALVVRITQEGEKLAPHLADMAFPYMPFMNDIPFEKLDYSGPGQTFYKRRTGGDLNGYNKGQGAFVELMKNPGGISAQDAVKAMGEIIAGIEGPEGDAFAQEANFAAFEALIDISMTEPGKRQAILKLIMEGTRTPTSIAEKWAGIKADSIIETEVSSLIDTAVKAGIISPELARYMRRKKKITFAAILWTLIRDILLPSSAILLAEFVEDVPEKK